MAIKIKNIKITSKESIRLPVNVVVPAETTNPIIPVSFMNIF